MGSKDTRARLVIAPRSLSPTDARRAGIAALERAGLKEPNNGWDAASLKHGPPDKRIAIPFSQLVAEASLSGTPTSLQQLLDTSDPVFGGMLPMMETNSPAIILTTSHASKTHKVSGPGQIAPTLTMLTGDILHHRAAACASSCTSITATAHHFRAYVLSSCAMIEAFLNTYASLAQWEGPEPEAFLKLKRPLPIRVRIICWLTAFAEKPRSVIAGSVAWDHFNKLRRLRNAMVHPQETYTAFQLKAMAAQLNLVREGVGGLLRLLRLLANEPTTTFIEQIKNAPPITYQKGS